MPTYWLITERYGNWIVDRDNSFQHFGLSDRKRNTASKVKPGDILIVYVIGKGCFSDLRKVASPPLVKLKLGGPYDAAFSVALSTEPFITPPEEKWIPVQQLADRLGFLSRSDWRQSFRNSLRSIPEVDGKLIERVLREASQSRKK